MGADANIKNHSGDTPLHIAASHDMEYIVMLLLHHNADSDMRNNTNETAVDLTKNHSYPHVKDLLMVNKFYSNALVEGVENNDVATVDRILQYDTVGRKNFNVNGSLHDSLLQKVARNKNYEICKLLVKFGADVSLLNYDNQRPFNAAEVNGQFSICKLLLKKRKEKKIMYRNALHVCARQNDLVMFKIHINKGDNVNETDEKMRTPLHEAMIFANDALCDLLLRYGADVHAKDSYMDDPIHLKNCYPIFHILDKIFAFFNSA